MTAEKKMTADQSPDANGPTVLIVEDDVRIANVVAEVAEALGLNPLLAASLSEAKAMLEGVTPDIILADVDLAPDGGGGFELLGHCLATSPPFGGTFVFVTGYEAAAIQAEAEARFGVTPSVLSKPFTVREFSRAVFPR